MKHKYTNIHSINTLLQNSPTILNIQDKLQQLQQLHNTVTNLLPPIIAKYCSVANLRDGVLILTTTSPVWNHQINFLKMDLLDKLRNSNAAWAGIASISVKTDYLPEDLMVYQQNNDHSNHKSNDKQKDRLKNFTISTKTAKIINNIATNDINHPPLAMALKNLARKLEI